MKKYFVTTIMLLSLLVSSLSATSFAADKDPAAAAAPASKDKKDKTATPAGKKTKKVKKKVGSGTADMSPLNFLPFGVGQFREGRPLMGGVLGGGQVMMLYLYMDRKKQIDASNKDASATIADINANGGTIDSATQSYLDRNASYVKKTNSEASLCLVGFLGLWAAGVVDAVWDPLGMHKADASKAKAAMEMEEGAQKWALEREIENTQTRPRLSAFALPTLDHSKSTFGLTLQKSFR
ncbi:MAG: hypothetical protein H7249_16590 [Chitinophagaceae bacterium]|nr:hypothetical protein [Oligoflexus sp.]